MEGACSFETLVTIYKTTRFHNPEDCNLNVHSHENLRTHPRDILSLYSLSVNNFSQSRWDVI
jgi:hypothetical protein